jgi:hypothetical protein
MSKVKMQSQMAKKNAKNHLTMIAKNLNRKSSFVNRHSSFVIRHSSFVIRHLERVSNPKIPNNILKLQLIDVPSVIGGI